MSRLAEQPAVYRASPPGRELWSHEFLDALSLARHRAMASKLRREPDLIRVADANARRWLTSGNYDAGEEQSVREWLPLMKPGRFESLLDTLTSDSERAIRMRQSSPFTGILSKVEYRSLREQLVKEWTDHAS